MECLWRAESVTVLVAVLNQLLDPKGPEAAAWYDHRFGGRGVFGTPVGAYSMGGRVHSTLVLVIESPDGNRQEVHWRGVDEARSLAYWLSMMLRMAACKQVDHDVVPLYDINKALGVLDALYHRASHGGRLDHQAIPRYIDRWNAKLFHHHHQPLLVDERPVPVIR